MRPGSLAKCAYSEWISYTNLVVRRRTGIQCCPTPYWNTIVVPFSKEYPYTGCFSGFAVNGVTFASLQMSDY
jgi:hypothetical protein